MSLVRFSTQVLRHQVSQLIVGRYALWLDCSVFVVIADEVNLCFDVFVVFAHYRVLDHFDAGVVVFEERCRSLFR